MFESRISAGATEELPGWQKPHAQTVAWSYDVEGHAQKMRWTILWIGKQESGSMVQSFASLFGWSSIQTVGTRICRRIARSLLANCLEMLVLGTNWTTWHLVVSQQLCEISHKMDSGMWQTFCKADFLHSSTQTISNNIVMWDTRHSLADCVCSKTQTMQATLRTQSQPQEVSCVFLEAEHLSQSVGCARNKLRFRTVPQSLKLFLWMLDYAWMGYLLLIFVTWWSQCYVQLTTGFKPNIQATRKLAQFLIPKPRPRKSEED